MNHIDTPSPSPKAPTFDPAWHRLVMTVGLPYSGKTQWAKATAAPIVSPDCIRLAMHGRRFAREAEPLVWATARYMVEALFLAGSPVVVLDSTALTEELRARWIEPAKWVTLFAVMPATADECFGRAAGDPELVPVMERMRGVYVPPIFTDHNVPPEVIANPHKLVSYAVGFQPRCDI